MTLMDADPVLSSKLDQVLETTKNSQINTTDLEYNVRPSHEVLKSEAFAKLPEVTYEYQKAALEKVVKVFVDGSFESVKNLAEELSKSVRTFIVPNLYEEVAAYVEPKLGHGGVFGSNAYLFSLEVLSAYSDKYGVHPDFRPREPQDQACPTFNSLVALIRNMVRPAYGDRLLHKYLTYRFAELALSERFANKVAVVLVPNLPKEEAKVLTDSLFPGQPGFKFTIDETKEELNFKSIALKLFRKLSEGYFNELLHSKE